MPLYGYFKVPLTVPHLAVEDDQWTEHTVLGWVLGVVEMVLPILTVLTTFMCFFFFFLFFQLEFNEGTCVSRNV